MFDVDKFISELNSIKSFNGKIKFADQNLNRIGSGSGRIVYDLGEDKVLKLAKNIKGIAQNNVEGDIGDDYMADGIVAKVYDTAENDSWIISQKARKVTEKRIKELTEIPNLKDLHNFLFNNTGNRTTINQDEELKEFFWKNEFASELANFVANYGQNVGDMGRASSYGEVVQDGQPAIVLTDYGINDEVFDTHYNRERKLKYNLYELNYGGGIPYGDYLSDIGNVSQEVRHGMWALIPDGVGDGDEINEEFVNFVMDRPVYPKQAIDKLPMLSDIFHANLNNLKKIINFVENPTNFVKNLIALQNYLVNHNYYDRDLIQISDKPELNKEFQSIDMDEMFAGGGGTKFTTDDNVSGDGFPTYDNTADTYPSIHNNLDANSALYNEDLEYNHVDDATKDEYILNENSINFELPKKLDNYGCYDIKINDNKIGEICISDRGIQGNNHYITIDKIFINDEHRGKGYANSAMNVVLDYANKNNVIIALTPDNMWNVNKNKLINWYKSLGFVMNTGKRKDFYTMQLMYKIPENYKKKYLEVNENTTTSIEEINENISNIQHLPFISEIKSIGGKIYSVGGAVRDEFLGKQSKDLDVLITGVPLDELGQILTKYGTVKLVGESFGVYKFIPEGSNEEIDIAIPRTETPTGGGGHKDFDIKSDHKLPIEKDLYRRDFTINAIAKDINGKIIDPYNGQEDLKNKIIRAVNPDAFSDDPLRMLRAVQFASRFGFTIEPHTLEMIQKNLDSVGNIAFERRFIELEKIQQKGDMRYGAQLLKDTGLFRKLFGYELNQSIIDDAPFNKVKTTGEFIFLLLQESQTPEALFKTRIHNLNDEYKEIKALNIGYKTNINNIVVARSIAHNMYLTYSKSLESDILPNLIKTACNDLLYDKYPKIVEELAINGNDLMELGLQGKTIGDMKKKLLLAVYADKIINNKEDLINMVKNTKNNIKEEISPETIENAKKNIPIQYTGIVIDDLRKDRLLQLFDKYIPDDWKIINENMHVTIKLGALDDIDPMKYHLNFPIHVNATHIGISDKAIALKVNIETDKIKSKNDIPHITLAYNKNGGAKPKDSNYITDWQELKRPIKIRGIFQEVPYTFNV